MIRATKSEGPISSEREWKHCQSTEWVVLHGQLVEAKDLQEGHVGREWWQDLERAGLLSPLGRTVLAEDWPAECYVPGAYRIGCLFDCSLNGIRYWNVYEGVCTTPTHYPYSGICTGYLILGCQNYCPWQRKL